MDLYSNFQFLIFTLLCFLIFLIVAFTCMNITCSLSGSSPDSSLVTGLGKFVDRMKGAGHASGTRRTYRQGMIAYNNFLRSASICSADVSHKLLLLFVAYLTSVLHLSFGTIQVYIYAVRDWAMENGFNDPVDVCARQRHLYNKFMSGVRRVTRPRKRLRLPMKRTQLKLALAALPRTGLPSCALIMLKSAMLLAYYGFLRSSEYLVTATNEGSRLRRKDIKFITETSDVDSRVKLRLRRSKTSQYQCVYIDIFANGLNDCPVRALKDYVRQFAHQPGESLFWYLNKPLTAIKFNQLFRLTLGKCNLDPMKYSSHSLRSGGATVAAEAGVPTWIIQRLGRWKSDCYKVYIESDKRSLLTAQRALDL